MLLLLEHSLLGRFTDILSDGCQDGLRLFFKNRAVLCLPVARFTKYFTTILRLSYDNAIVTIDLRRMTNLPNRLTKGARLFLGMIHLQNCKVV